MDLELTRDETTAGLIRVLIADDHPVLRSGIRALLEQAPDIEVIAEASDGREAIALTRKLQPDVLLLDVEMPHFSGVDVARRLKDEGSRVRVLVLSAYSDREYIFGLLAAGATGYLSKQEALTTIADAVRGVAAGADGWLSRKVLSEMMGGGATRTEDDAFNQLSEREVEVLRLIAHGNTNPEIADALHLAESTVKNHVTRIYGKLGFRSRAEAVAYCWQEGLMTD